MTLLGPCVEVSDAKNTPPAWTIRADRGGESPENGWYIHDTSENILENIIAHDPPLASVAIVMWRDVRNHGWKDVYKKIYSDEALTEIKILFDKMPFARRYSKPVLDLAAYCGMTKERTDQLFRDSGKEDTFKGHYIDLYDCTYS